MCKFDSPKNRDYQQIRIYVEEYADKISLEKEEARRAVNAAQDAQEAEKAAQSAKRVVQVAREASG